MPVTTPTRHTTRLGRVRHRLRFCPRRHHGGALVVRGAPAADLGHDHVTAIQTPAGPEAAEHALAWLARQARWQSTLADLERP